MGGLTAPALPEGKTLGELPVMEDKQKKKITKPYSPEFRERAVRLLMEHRDEYQSEAAALTAIAGKSGCSPDSLRAWARQVQRDGGERPGQTSEEKARIKQLERENRELRQANEILRKGEPVKPPLVQAHWRTRILPKRERQCGTASALPVAARPRVSQMIVFIGSVAHIA
jgi:transposase